MWCRADHDQGPHGYPVLEVEPMTLLSYSCLLVTPSYFLTNSHCNPITREAPQLLHGRTAGSPCRDRNDPGSLIASFTEPKLTRRRKTGEKREAQRKPDRPEEVRRLVTILFLETFLEAEVEFVDLPDSGTRMSNQVYLLLTDVVILIAGSSKECDQIS